MKINNSSVPFFTEHGIQILHLVDTKEINNIRHLSEEYKFCNVDVEFNVLIDEHKAYEDLLNFISNTSDINAQLTLKNCKIYETDWIASSQLSLDIIKHIKLFGFNKFSNPMKLDNCYRSCAVIDYRSIDITKPYQENFALRALLRDQEHDVLRHYMFYLLDNTYVNVL